ncbi:hypothetical protein PFISCL1PPCAC_27169, partial [Pristionchus fissidentatus]
LLPFVLIEARDHSFNRKAKIATKKHLGFVGLPGNGEFHINYQDGCAHYCEQNFEEECSGVVRCPFGEKLILGVRTHSMSAEWEGTCDIENVHHSHSLCCNQSVFKKDDFHP